MNQPLRETSGGSHQRAVRLVDADVHQAPRHPDDIRRYLPAYFREVPLGDGAGSPWASPIGVNRADALPSEGGPPGSSPQHMARQHLDPFGIDYAILTGSHILALGVHPHGDYAAALAHAYNQWMIEHWLSADSRFRGSLIISPQNSQAAAREIRALGDHPGIVQVLMCSATRLPFGNAFYWPIYEAACEMQLPVAVHPGTEGKGIANGFIAGTPATYLEWHTNLPQNYMGQITSLVLSGVFEAFPTMRFVAIEGGLAWLPHLMWRMDKNWKGLRMLAPALKRLPSEYILEHMRFTTQPIEEPEKPEHLLAILEMIHAHRTVMFSSDYPHWDNDSPRHGLPKLPADLAERIFFRNALELYRLPEFIPADGPASIATGRDPRPLGQNLNTAHQAESAP